MLLVAGGWAGASVADIGVGGQMSRGAVNFHFGTKSDLLQRVLQDTVTRFIAPAQDASSLDDLLDRYWSAMTSDPFEAQVAATLWQEASGPSPQLEPAVIEHYQAAVGRLTNDVARLQRDGVVAADRSAEGLAQMLASALGGLVLAAGRREVSAGCSTFAELKATLILGMTPPVTRAADGPTRPRAHREIVRNAG